MAAGEVRLVRDYEARLRPLAADDLDRLHGLCIGVGWPHRAEDLRLLMAVGDGFMACDAIGRAIGSAMWFASGAGFATIGMVITTPPLQSLGAGRWLMDHVLARCAGRDLMLVATRAAYRLYFAAGFEPFGIVAQHQGTARAPSPVRPESGGRLRPVAEGDLPALLGLDAAGFGAARTAILPALLAASDAVILERGGAPAGFVFDRPFGRGRVVGPLVAASASDAVALAADVMTRHAGTFLRLDLPVWERPAASGAGFGVPAGGAAEATFSGFLTGCGLERLDRNTLMRKARSGPAHESGPVRESGLMQESSLPAAGAGDIMTFALAAQALG